MDTTWETLFKGTDCVDSLIQRILGKDSCACFADSLLFRHPEADTYIYTVTGRLLVNHWEFPQTKQPPGQRRKDLLLMT